MKQITSMLMLILMFAIIANPAIAMHFCGEKLHSVDIINTNHENLCCGIPENDIQDCSEETNNFHGNISFSKKGCCDIQQVKISTDNYQYQDNQINLNNIIPSIKIILNVFNILLDWFVFDDLVFNENDFPPKGLSRQNLDILNFICIYRI